MPYSDVDHINKQPTAEVLASINMGSLFDKTMIILSSTVATETSN